MIKKNKIRFGILYESLNFNLMENRPLKDNNLQFLYIVLTDDCKLLYYNSDKYLKMNCHEIVGFEYDGSERIIQLYRLSDFHIIKDSSIYFRYKGKTPLDDSEIGYYHIGKDEYNEMLLHEKVLFEQKIKSYNYNRGKPTKEYYCTIDKKHIYKLSKRESFLIEYSEIHNSLKVKSEAFIATPFSEHKFNFTNYLKDLYDKEKKRITSLNINDIIDSYKLSMNTIYLTKNGGDDSINVVEESECIYRDEYLDTLLPFVQSDLYYDRGYGCLEFKEADKEN